MTSISSQFGSFNALMNLKRAEENQNRTMGRLSTGARIQESKDDPANFATSQQLRAEIKAHRQLRSANFEAIGMVQIADSTLGEAVNLVNRAMELAVWSASDTLGPDGGALKIARNDEYQEILNSLDDLNDTTEVNGRPVFGPTGVAITANINTEVNSASDQETITTQPFSSVALALAGTDITTTAGADVVLAQLRPALESMTRQQATMGTMQRRLERNIETINDNIDSYTAEESRIRDMDVATETVNLTKYQIQNRSGLAAIAQANLTTDAVFQLLS